MGKKIEPLRFFSYVTYKKCFQFASDASASICSVFQTSSKANYLTRYGQKICVKK